MKKALIIALSLCGFAITSAQAEVVQMNGSTLVHEQNFSKALGPADGTFIASGYGEMKDIKTPIKAQAKIKSLNTMYAHPTNLGRTGNDSAERTVYNEEYNR